MPALWAAPTTTAADRKDSIRQVVARVDVAAQGTSAQVRVRITWAGGGQTAGVLVRPLARYRERTDSARICARVQELTQVGWSLEAIACQLAADGFPPLRRGQRWSRVRVQTLRRQVGRGNTHRQGHSRAALGPDEWWAREVAERLCVPRSSLFTWIQRGVVRARKERDGMQRWIVWADAPELERLREYRHRDIGAEQRRRWTAVSSLSEHQKGSTA